MGIAQSISVPRAWPVPSLAAMAFCTLIPAAFILERAFGPEFRWETFAPTTAHLVYALCWPLLNSWIIYVIRAGWHLESAFNERMVCLAHGFSFAVASSVGLVYAIYLPLFLLAILLFGLGLLGMMPFFSLVSTLRLNECLRPRLLNKFFASGACTAALILVMLGLREIRFNLALHFSGRPSVPREAASVIQSAGPDEIYQRFCRDNLNLEHLPYVILERIYPVSWDYAVEHYRQRTGRRPNCPARL